MERSLVCSGFSSQPGYILRPGRKMFCNIQPGSGIYATGDPVIGNMAEDISY